ncbi:MAG: hypothetical protein V4539_09320 [Bacteroidota bacterium]
MKISSTDYTDVLHEMINQRWAGNEFVAFPDDSVALQKEELFCFATAYEAMEFCYEMSTDVDRYEYLSLRSVCHSMSEGLQDKELLVEKNGLVDVGQMVTLHYQRLEGQQLINDQKQNVMNQKNYDFLKDQVKFTGFGEGLENELKEKLEKQTPDFQIAHKTKFGNDEVSSVLHFKKSDQTDMYFFNRYDTTLKPEGTKDEMTQAFYINKGNNNITLKEAFNLMNGRAIHKEFAKLEKVGEGENARFKPTDEKYTAWMKLDFKEADEQGNFKQLKYSENYGYDLNAALAKHPIKELENENDKTKLVDSLQKGNRQSVTFVQNGNEQKHFIEANPQFKTINIYDSNMQRLNGKQAQDEKQGQGEQRSAKQNAKNESQNAGDADDSDAMPKASNKRRKKQSNSVH